jgi:ring-1,2-phenylacetyl-CoA epoxidase subunit PaaD
MPAMAMSAPSPVNQSVPPDQASGAPHEQACGAQHDQTCGHPREQACGLWSAAWEVLSQIPDPEVPAITLVELGIVRELRLLEDGTSGVEVVLTPTYSGCPATELIQQQVREALARFGEVRLVMRRSPAWTTDWISEAGREKLRAYGIAPPGRCVSPAEQPVHWLPQAGRAPRLSCPRCGSSQTEQLSAFGSTACKSLFRCLDCREPFEYFKPI